MQACKWYLSRIVRARVNWSRGLVIMCVKWEVHTRSRRWVRLGAFAAGAGRRATNQPRLCSQAHGSAQEQLNVPDRLVRRSPCAPLPH